MKTEAAILTQSGVSRPYSKNCPLVVEEVTLAAPGNGEVLVEIHAAGICHSDLSVVNGDRMRPLPMALGHEAAGVVLETGDGVDDLSPGDHVVMVFVPSCGRCLPCAVGRPALCEPAAKANLSGELLGGGRRIRWRGEDIHHHLGISAFARHAVVSRRSLIKIDRELPLAEAALLSCAAITGIGSVFNTAQMPPGASALIVGLGGVGLSALMAARMLGAQPLIAVDVMPDKLKLATDLGASMVVDASEQTVIERIREETHGGVDFGFETAGNVAAMEIAYRATRRGGTTTTAGLSHPERMFAMQHVGLVAEERVVKGSYVGSCVPMRDIPKILGLYRSGHLPLSHLMSTTMPLSDINQGMDNLADGNTVRQILLPQTT